MARTGSAYQELLGLARHSFLAYVVESSSPVVVDEGDRRLLKLFRELHEKERHYVERAFELVDQAGFGADLPTYALGLSNFNFLRPAKLAEHWSSQVTDEIARLEALRGRVGPGDPCPREFQRLVDDLLALRREELTAVTALLGAASAKASPARPAPAASPAPPGP